MFVPFLCSLLIRTCRRSSLVFYLSLILYLIKTISNFNWLSSPIFIRSENNVLTSCSLSDASMFLKTLCNNFSIGLTSGPLCMPLCNSNILVQNCLGHGVKDNVILALWGSTQFILKSHHSHLDLNIQNSISATSHLSAVKLTQKFLADRYFGISNKLLFNLSKYLLSIFDNYPGGILDEYEMRELLHFLNGEENFKNYFLNHTGVSPYYFGNCGVLWGTTYMQDTDLLWSLSYPLAIGVPWKFQARIAIGFLNLIKNLENVPFGPLHLCDIQLPNFGLQFFNGFPIVRAIDMDASFFQSYLVKFALNNQNISCRTDSDCSIFNCHFKCFLKYQKCYPRIVSNNFQNICKLIFQKHLLKRTPLVLYSRLHRLLSRCSGDQQDNNLFFQLYNFLWYSSDL